MNPTNSSHENPTQVWTHTASYDLLMPRKCLRRVPMLAEASHVPLTNCCPIRGGSTSICSHHNTQLSLIEPTKYPAQRCTILLKSWHALLPMPYQALYVALRLVSPFGKACGSQHRPVTIKFKYSYWILNIILMLSYFPLVSSLHDFDSIKGIVLMLCVLLFYLSLPLWYYHPNFFCMYDKLW